jgi:cysteinyl-tRNA synthetase
MRIFNTLSRKKEEFQTLEPGKVRLYVCGVTVYNKAHVGHAMSALVFDILRRYLQYRGFDVKHVTNFTDVDDKIIDRANQLHVDPAQLAEGYITELKEQFKALNVLPATAYPRATEEMDTIIEMIRKLVEKECAYPAGGDVYFRVQRDKEYGKLSNRRIQDMKSGARIEIGEKKEDPLDFALWKAAKPGEPAWKSPWGQGRPGWHIECSAMNLSHLGEQIDIHGGGNDLIFPHHENEIAQTESLTGKPFARYWVHNGMMTFSGEKMSKSVGNVVTIEEFLKEHSADALRLMILNSGYRNPLTFSEEVVAQAESALDRLRSALRPALPGASGAPQASQQALAVQLKKTKEGFLACMDDDFNSAGALGMIFDLVRQVNQVRADGGTDVELADAQKELRTLLDVFGLEIEKSGSDRADAGPFIELLIELRKKLRAKKLWELSDAIREDLEKLGVILEDSKEGTTWRWR